MITVSDILRYLDDEGYNYSFNGDLCLCKSGIKGFSSLSNYKEDTITWIKKIPEDLDLISHKKIKLAVIEAGVDIKDFLLSNSIVINNSKEVFFTIIEEFFAPKVVNTVASDAYISNDVVLGKNVAIGHKCVIDGPIFIGDNSVIHDNVVIKNKVSIGKNVVIQPLTTIGEDGFGYSENSNHKKTMIKHYGGVIIGNDVFIGSHVNIARGTIDDTTICDGVKIAPSTHIGHNAFIGCDSTIITSNIFGSVSIGENAYITDSVIRNQCRIGSNATVGMGSVVTKNVVDNITVVGAPAKELKRKKE